MTEQNLNSLSYADNNEYAIRSCDRIGQRRYSHKTSQIVDVWLFRKSSQVQSLATSTKTIIGIIVCCLVTVTVVLVNASHRSRPNLAPDFSGNDPGKEIIVHIMGDTLTDFAEILVDKGIIASKQAFINAAKSKGISAGYYRLHKHIPAAVALKYLTTQTAKYKVGEFIITPGTTLLSRRDNRGRVVPGIADLLAKASCVRLNNRSSCFTSIKDIIHVASTASFDALGIPVWARAAVAKIGNDPRRLEGLIYAATWDSIDPQESAVKKLHDLITRSESRIVNIVALADSDIHHYHTYDLTVIGSIVEREAGKVSDYGKIARVIYNRLASRPDLMRLDMDSTVNYGLGESSLDFDPENLSKVTQWNTRVIFGLPATPIGSVSDKSLYAAAHPTQGKWKYFVTVDARGTTLFANTLEEHEKNIIIGCRNHFLTTVC